MSILNLRSTSSTLLSLLLLTSLFRFGEASNSTLARRKEYPAVQGVYLCTEEDFAGQCNWIQLDPEAIKNNECIMLEHSGGIMSLGPDYGLAVQVFTNSVTKKCDADSTIQLVCPGWKNMMELGFVQSEKIWVRARNVPEHPYISNICPYVMDQ